MFAFKDMFFISGLVLAAIDQSIRLTDKCVLTSSSVVHAGLSFAVREQCPIRIGLA